MPQYLDYINFINQRMELDRLIKRIEKLSAEKKELEGRLDVLNSELYEINERVEELQKQ